MSLDIRDFLILNCIVYTKYFCNPKYSYNLIGKSIYDFALNFKYELDNNNDMPGEISEEEFENIIFTIKTEKDFFEKLKVLDIDNSVYGNLDGSKRVVNVCFSFENYLILVYKGTSGSLEWFDNANGTYFDVTDTSQQISALNYFDFIFKKYCKKSSKVFVTGHSKGGNKAKYVGVMRGEYKNFCAVYSFDGQGFNLSFLEKYKDKILCNKHKIYSISNEYDFVNVILFSVAKNEIFIKSNTSFGNDKSISSQIMHRYGGWHSPYSMFKVENGRVLLNDIVEQSDLMRNLKYFLNYLAKNMSKEDNCFMYYTLASYMAKDNLKFFGNDFSKTPRGFYKRFFDLIKNFEKLDKSLSFVEIVNLLRPIFDEIHSEIIIKTYKSKYSITTVIYGDRKEKVSFIEKLKSNDSEVKNIDYEIRFRKIFKKTDSVVKQVFYKNKVKKFIPVESKSNILNSIFLKLTELKSKF